MIWVSQITVFMKFYAEEKFVVYTDEAHAPAFVETVSSLTQRNGLKRISRCYSTDNEVY